MYTYACMHMCVYINIHRSIFYLYIYIDYVFYMFQVHHREDMQQAGYAGVVDVMAHLFSVSRDEMVTELARMMPAEAMSLARCSRGLRVRVARRVHGFIWRLRPWRGCG